MNQPTIIRTYANQSPEAKSLRLLEEVSVPADAVTLLGSKSWALGSGGVV